ncbi:MAG: hypothetical protein ACFFCO_11300 [Promethearchaeota archaeon]
MKILQTESADIRTFEESEWSVIPLNIPVLLVEPPDFSLELNEAKLEQVLPGEIDFVPSIGVRHIDMLTHYALLEESLVKHKEIWKTLAKK